MKMKLGKAAALLTAAVMTATLGTGAALAAETDGASYSYLAGQQQNASRHAVFAESASITTDDEREAFFTAHGIGGDGAYHTAQRLDAEALVEAGVIDRETADQIEAYAARKNDGLHSAYVGKAGLSASERHGFYEKLASSGAETDPVGALLTAGVITQEQADAINAYLAQNP